MRPPITRWLWLRRLQAVLGIRGASAFSIIGEVEPAVRLAASTFVLGAFAVAVAAEYFAAAHLVMTVPSTDRVLIDGGLLVAMNRDAWDELRREVFVF